MLMRWHMSDMEAGIEHPACRQGGVSTGGGWEPEGLVCGGAVWGQRFWVCCLCDDASGNRGHACPEDGVCSLGW